MAKFNSATFLRGAEQQLAKGNFPAVLINASAALALGSPAAAAYLCAYYHGLMAEGMKTPLGPTPDTISNFGIMHNLAEAFKVDGYHQFTRTYMAFFCDPKTPPSLLKAVGMATTEYMQYIKAAQRQYTEETLVDFRTAKHMAEAMEVAVVKQVMLKTLEMDAPFHPPLPQDYHHPHPGQMMPPVHPQHGQGYHPHPGQMMPPAYPHHAPVVVYHPHPGQMHDPKVQLMGQVSNHDAPVVKAKSGGDGCAIS